MVYSVFCIGGYPGSGHVQVFMLSARQHLNTYTGKIPGVETSHLERGDSWDTLADIDLFFSLEVTEAFETSFTKLSKGRGNELLCAWGVLSPLASFLILGSIFI